ncbi:hypothetical protein EDB82DRAFT_494927 [Fusarium venenatum]|uniref:uncharacterized protein n=1 Tax=Fusarium venenatum TaxID=56646 RepID=UPI001DEB688C|nr:hypothetical protein EDB82DRAFT_494927 [Fusarium venenatum]
MPLDRSFGININKGLPPLQRNILHSCSNRIVKKSLHLLLLLYKTYHQTMSSPLTYRGWTPINRPHSQSRIDWLLRAAEANGDLILSPTSTSGQQPGLASRPDQVSSSPSSPCLRSRPRPTPLSSLPTPPLTPAPAPSPSSRSKKRPDRCCEHCGNIFNYKNFADHRKVHRLEGVEGARAWPCEQCKKHPKGCRVATNPTRLGTYSCSCCLKGHKKCEYTGLKQHRQGEVDRHPKISRPWEL